MLYRFAKVVIICCMRMVYRVRVTGLEHVPAEGGVIVCANHRSNMDPVLIGCFIPRELSFMAKKSLMEIPLLGGLFRRLNAFPVNRGAADLSAVKTALRILKDGGVLNMYPEGTRSKDGRLRPFKPGACLIAYKADVPILPVCIRGGYGLFSRVEIQYGEPLYPRQIVPDASDESIQQMNGQLYNTVKTLLEEGRNED